MSDDAAKPDEASADVAEDLANAATVPKKQRGLRRGGNGRSYSHTLRREMETYVVELRSEQGIVKYAELRDAVRAKFGCGIGVAEKAVEAASAAVLDEFYRRVADAPTMIFDGYVEIYRTNMKKGDMREARKTLDSLRDMFGIKGTTRVDLTIRPGGGVDGVSLEDLDAFSDADLEVMAKWDQVRPRMIDVPASDAMDDVASAGVDAVDEMSNNGGNSDGG